MFVTSIIPTIGRKALKRAVHSVLDQRFSGADYEIIVVNDSGMPLPDEEWHHSPFVKILNTHHVERCVARNVGAALARGQYLHFLDDDDWLLPGALETFWMFSRQHADSSWLYGGTIVVDREDQPLIHLIHRLEPNCFVQVMAGEWIPLQASFIKRTDFHKVGGFNPLIPGIEDADLARRMALHFDFCGTNELVAAVGMGVAGSTTNQSKARLDGRQARELILSEPGVYRRLWQSANRADWYGRIVRIYLTSMVWNLSNGRLFAAMSRLSYGLRAISTSLFSSLFQRQYWAAITRQYESETFARGRSEMQALLGRK